MKTDKRITSFDDHLDEQYGKVGTESRDKFQEEFETFKIGVLIQEARKKQHMTQEQLAEKVGTTKYYISRIEDYQSIWVVMIILNFALPMLALMDADAKKNQIILNR
jgi:DNA-binding XRE family transcriptional regulator